MSEHILWPESVKPYQCDKNCKIVFQLSLFSFGSPSMEKIGEHFCDDDDETLTDAKIIERRALDPRNNNLYWSLCRAIARLIKLSWFMIVWYYSMCDVITTLNNNNSKTILYVFIIYAQYKEFHDEQKLLSEKPIFWNHTWWNHQLRFKEILEDVIIYVVNIHIFNFKKICLRNVVQRMNNHFW